MTLLHRAAATLSLLMLCCAGTTASAQTPGSRSTDEEVRFPSDPGIMLAGSLELPRGFGSGPFPVAVIVPGGGAFARGGFVNIRARLLASGIAILIFDKRGQGRSTGSFVDTIPAMERDVAAAVAFLRTRPDIDGRRIALIGTSQGAVAAPMVASRDPAVAAIVMLSGPVGPRRELFLGILRSHLRRAGKSPGQIEQVAAAVGGWMEARSRRAADAEIARLRQGAIAAFAAAGFSRAEAEGFAATLDNDVVLSMFEAAPDRALAAVRAPVLAVYGSRDDVIAPTQSAAAAEAALANNRDAVVVSVPGMTHVLTRADQDPGEAALQDGTMPVVTDIVGVWLARRLTSSQPVR